MNLTLLSPLGFLAGLAALAGGLYLLQRLRVRHREVDVVTTLFWQEAVQDARARVLVDRFRHPWAYALALAILGLLWGAFAAPERQSEPESAVLLMLDASAASGDSAAFDAAKAELLTQAKEYDKSAREVLACGAAPRTLLRPGEEALLLGARLAELEQVATPSRVHETLEALALEERVPTRVLVFHGAPLDANRLTLLPDHLQVEEVPLGAETDVPPNAGVVALGIVEAESGAWDAVDVLVEVRSTDGSVPSLVLSIDGKAISEKAQTSTSAKGGTVFRWRDVPAQGGRMEARLGSGDRTAFDDVAALRLPDRQPIRVQIAPGLGAELQASIRAVLDNDASIAVVESNPAIVIRWRGDRLGADLPALVLCPSAEQEESFLVTHERDRAPEAVLAEVTGSLALTQIDATSLADAAQAPITLGARAATAQANQREIAVWEELFRDGFDFTSSRAFPLFLGGSLRWLSTAEEVTSWVAAGETKIHTDRLQRSDGEVDHALRGTTIPPLAGSYVTASGDEVFASVLSPGATDPGSSEGTDARERIQVANSPFDPVSWILVIALLLLLLEWRQVRTGRMP